MNPVLEINDLTKLYRNGRGIGGVSLNVYQGDIFGLLGPNGAGKTTLLKLMTGLIRAQRGRIRLFTCDIEEDFEQAMRSVGCMIESADFYDFISPVSYLRMAARFYPGVTEARISEALELVGMSKYRNEKIKSFSTGMKQKLALAAAILHDPKLILLDEPTNGLDIEGVVMFRRLVAKLSRERGTTFIISSHMIHELEQLCNRVAIILDGKLRSEGRVDRLLTENATLESFYIGELGKAKEAVNNEQLASSG